MQNATVLAVLMLLCVYYPSTEYTPLSYLISILKYLLQDHIIQNFKEAVQLEINWGKYYLEEGILGLKLSNLEEYIQYLGNKRITTLGLPEQWHSAKNPFNWLDEMTQGAMTETNFFEGRVREYSSGTLDWD